MSPSWRAGIGIQSGGIPETVLCCLGIFRRFPPLPQSPVHLMEAPTDVGHLLGVFPLHATPQVSLLLWADTVAVGGLRRLPGDMG